ncbi:MAG TPA: hypothetical protein VJI13_06300 [Candidatus Norongarragalinales archaeon]|nr:hypothetical protein [Candidatus Norongarragalinales archaeon]
MSGETKLRGNSLIVQGMALLEEVTPIRPVKDEEPDSYENGMGGRASLLGLKHRQVYTLLAIGLIYALFLVLTGEA